MQPGTKIDQNVILSTTAEVLPYLLPYVTLGFTPLTTRGGPDNKAGGNGRGRFQFCSLNAVVGSFRGAV